MKKQKTRKVKSYKFNKEGFFIDIEEDSNFYYVWLYDTNFNPKHYILGRPKSECSYKKVLKIVKDEINDRIRWYMDKYIFNDEYIMEKYEDGEYEMEEDDDD